MDRGSTTNLFNFYCISYTNANIFFFSILDLRPSATYAPRFRATVILTLRMRQTDRCSILNENYASWSLNFRIAHFAVATVLDCAKLDDFMKPSALRSIESLALDWSVCSYFDWSINMAYNFQMALFFDSIFQHWTQTYFRVRYLVDWFQLKTNP